MLSNPPASHPDVPSTRRGFALTLLTRTKNPSQLAQAIYLSHETVPHAMLSGDEAESVGEGLGIERVDSSYFFTEQRWKEHRRGLGLPEGPYPPGESPSQGEPREPLDQMPTGTVGAVALDCRGCIASVTSTGGKTNKMVGRIGDTPQMGSGFWAEEWKENRPFKKILNALYRLRQRRAVGVSGTGDGDVSLLPRLPFPVHDRAVHDVAFHSVGNLFYDCPTCTIQKGIDQDCVQRMRGGFAKKWWDRRSHRPRRKWQL
jgi:beta-aspartyl-peptidase (threonine type)